MVSFLRKTTEKNQLIHPISVRLFTITPIAYASLWRREPLPIQSYCFLCSALEAAHLPQFQYHHPSADDDAQQRYETSQIVGVGEQPSETTAAAVMVTSCDEPPTAEPRVVASAGETAATTLVDNDDRQQQYQTHNRSRRPQQPSVGSAQSNEDELGKSDAPREDMIFFVEIPI